MGAADDDSSNNTQKACYQGLEKRHGHSAEGEAFADALGTGLGKDADAPLSPKQQQQTAEDIEEIIRNLPSWKQQLSLRGYIVGTAFGLLFTIIYLKLTLGTAGIIPSLNIPGGLISFAAMKALTSAGAGLNVAQRAPLLHGLLFQPFGLQENAVMQTYLLSMCAGGFGSYITGMGYQAYLNLGGAPRGTPGFDPSAVFDPIPSTTVPYLLCISVLGAFMLIGMRKLMIVDWRLPFPSGTASGIMLTSFHTASGAAEAIRKVKVLGATGAASFAFSVAKWFVNGSDYACGLGAWPTFGFAAMKYTWNFDWQLNYVGAGMICPHVTNWSMLFGAILSWGFMWPLLARREGDWYPAGLDSHDFQGLFGYKVFLVIAILMGEGLYMVLKVLVSSFRDTAKRMRAANAARRLPSSLRGRGVSWQFFASAGAGAAPSAPAAAEGLRQVDQHAAPVMADGLPLDKGSPATRGGGAAAAQAQADQGPEGEEEEEQLVAFKETPEERRLRTTVFLRDAIPWWLAPAGYGGLAVLSAVLIPRVFAPVKWYHVVVAYAITPLFALPNSYGCGLTDWDMSSMYAKLALFVFAAWAGAAGNGVVVGLGICGVVLSATSSAATLMGDFRTGYICLAAPRAMFGAQLVGQLVGAVLTPMAFLLFYKTGQVNVPGGPYPAPFADIYRGMAIIGTKGFGALPKHCGLLMGCFFAAGVLICLLRDAAPRRVARYIPSPMAMSVPFYIGAASAINFWLGSVVMHVWECFSPAGAEQLGPTVGAGLLVGDGLWSIPSSMLAIAGHAPPLCLGFWPRGTAGCALPYCAGVWRGGSAMGPAGALGGGGGH